MAGTLGKITGILVEGSGATVAGLVQGQAGTNITQASLSSIAYIVNRLDGQSWTQTGSGTLTISSVVFDVPVATDPRYTQSGGYNFLTMIPAACFDQRAKNYEIRVTFTPVSGEPFVQVWGGVTL